MDPWYEQDDFWETVYPTMFSEERVEAAVSDVDHLLTRMDLSEGSAVLDLACGPGRHAIAFAQSGFCVTATDSSQSAVSYLQRWAGELSLPIRTEVCDVLGGSFSRESFNIVLSYNVIYHGRRHQFAAAIEHVHSLL